MRLSRMWVLLLGAGLLLWTGCTDITPPSMVVTPSPSTRPVAETGTPPPSPSPTQPPLAALVNDEPILLSQYERQVARYEASMSEAGEDPSTDQGQANLAEGRRWMLDVMIDQVLIEQAAQEAGVTVTAEEVTATVQSLREEVGEAAFNRWLEEEDMDLAEMHTRMRGDLIATRMANLVAEEVPQRAKHVHARHILLDTEEEARQVLSQLQAGGDFVALARTYSQDTSTRDHGGDLDFFPRGVLTSPEVEEAAFSLQPGQFSDVLQSSLGYHIVQVVERVPDMEISPENLRLLRDKAVREWLEGLRASADIQVFVTPSP